MEETNYKSGFVTLVGRPNVGKSTLMNCMIGQKISITSPRPQTTRRRVQTVYTCDEGQIIFMDTPGMHRAKTKLGEYMEIAAEGTLKDMDLILWVIEPQKAVSEADTKIAQKINASKIPVVLVINKVDRIKKEEILRVIDIYRGLCDFRDIVPCSAWKGDGIQDLIDCILKNLPCGPQYYDEDTVTEQPVRQIAAEIIREKALMCLREEVPHGIAISIEKFKKREGRKLIDIDASIICEKESHKGIIIGRKGAMLKKIGAAARPEIEDLVGCKVNLKLWVKVRKDWRDNVMMMRDFGYDKKDL